MCVGVCIHVFNIQTEYIHESRLLGLGSTIYTYIYMYMFCIRVRGKFACASFNMKAPLQVYRRMSVVFGTDYADTVTYTVLCSHCTFCSLEIAVVTYT